MGEGEGEGEGKGEGKAKGEDMGEGEGKGEGKGEGMDKAEGKGEGEGKCLDLIKKYWGKKTSVKSSVVVPFKISSDGGKRISFSHENVRN